MTEKEYYSKPRVSSSSLKWFEDSPRYFKAKLDKEIEEESKQYFEIGKKVHMRLLEPNEFSKNYIYLDFKTPKSENQRKFCEEYISSPIKDKQQKLITAYRNNYAAPANDEATLTAATKLKLELRSYLTYLKKRTMFKDVLTSSDNKYIESAYSLVQEHTAAKSLLYLGSADVLCNIVEHNEFIILFEHEGVECKSMIDRLVIDYDNKTIKLIDVKTTGHIGQFKESFETFKYYRQLAFYWMAIGAHFKESENINIFDEEWKHETYIVAIGKGDMTEVKVFEINEKLLSDGLDEINSLFTKLKWHFDNNKWEHSISYYENSGIEQL